MASALCIVADPAASPLDAALAGALSRALGGGGRWLSPGEALAIERIALSPDEIRQRVRVLIGAMPVDWAVFPGGLRRRRLLLADMDSTMITVECIDELADALGLRAPVAAITRRAMNGEIDFAAALRERVALLKGMPLATIADICRERVRPSPGAAALVATMKRSGAVCVLVSGGFRQFTSHVRALLGFDVDEANTLGARDGRLTGALEGPIRDATSKLEALERHRSHLSLAPDAVIALGDGANDLPMLQAAGLGIAYRAHARVRAALTTRIDHTSLRTALFYQGFEVGEIAATAEGADAACSRT